MRYLITLLAFVITFNSYAQSEKFGREISLTEKTSISKILTAPEDFVGKTVLVEGEILDVCAMAGCWMELKSDAENQKIKIKVKDGDIVFPVEAKGKNAVVEGTVYKIDLTKEEALEYYEHVAAEQGTEFDPATVTGPITFYQIKGLGAEIK
ncbi:MAG: DUF4920 domain-containing protein [Ignavibacteriaceae bacterium]